MTTTTKLNPFHLQPLLSDLYYHKDLLDFSAAGTSSLAAGIARANSRSIFPSTGSFRVTPIVSGIHSSRSWSKSYFDCLARFFSRQGFSHNR